jgi:CDP-diglyceride synthetase
MKNLIIRTLTGILFVAVIVAAICVHPLLFAGVFSVVVGFLIHEFYSFSKYEGSLWQRALGIFGGMYFFVASCLYAGSYTGYEIFLPYILIMMALFISGLYVRNTNPVIQWGLLLFTQCYCAGLLSLLSFIPYAMSPVYDPWPVLMIFIFIWLNDTGAFLIGTLLGKHRLFPRISPLKSWEGFFGGLAVVIIASLIFSRFSLMEMSWYYWLAFAVITTVFATWGDLLESLLKRTYGVKDSGNILPGHGGFFDRFDSVILVSPAVFVFYKLITLL